VYQRLPHIPIACALPRKTVQISDLPLHVCDPMHEGEPATQLFFQRANGGDHLVRGESLKPGLEGDGSRGLAGLQQ
jgi:hypothetical protein